ncbi:MAG: hypothetical protein Kow0088_08670 [Anaerolineales bacterium]
MFGQENTLAEYGILTWLKTLCGRNDNIKLKYDNTAQITLCSIGKNNRIEKLQIA